MKISVVMTTYNGQKYIKKQLESIELQTVKIDEVIIIDDCSNDDTVEIVNEFIHNKQLTGWILEENKNNLGYIENFKKV
ncbi:glycosyltransferase [Coprobacillaceae bacterium CR2/5/TPMF4]|nr:glycosyltransferase [Coprobacillaceae bacterium CR2/5/TPMF4]